MSSRPRHLAAGLARPRRTPAGLGGVVGGATEEAGTVVGGLLP